MTKYYKNEMNLAIIGGNLERLGNLSSTPTNPDNYSQIGTVIKDYRDTLNDIVSDGHKSQVDRANDLIIQVKKCEKVYDLITDLFYE